MWDLLFSEGSSLELVDYVCVTMLLKIRHECELSYSQSRFGVLTLPSTAVRYEFRINTPAALSSLRCINEAKDSCA